MAKMLVDVFERPCAVPRELAALGVEVELAPLAAGDYVPAPGLLVERKSVRDLHLCVIQGRFWRQIGALRRASDRPFLLIEGDDIDRGPLVPNAVRGICLAVAEQGVTVIRSSSERDSALWLARIAARATSVRRPAGRPVYDQTPAARGDIAEAVLAAVPGISIVLARRLLTRFGTIATTIAAGAEAWRTVEGIGPERAASLARAFGRTPS